MRVAVYPPERHTWPALLAHTRRAEDAGVDEVLLPDHLAFGLPQLEAWTAITALAAATSRVRLGFGVLSATFRPPGLFARMVDALDEIADGRVSIGLGAGRAEGAGEHEQFGLPFPSPGRRVALLDACCATLRRRCARPPRLVLGSSGDRALAVVARHADEWNCGSSSLHRAAERLARLDRLADRPILRSAHVQLRVGESPTTESARLYNVHLGLHGGPAQMLGRAGELRRLGFDGIWLNTVDRAGFERTLEHVAGLHAL